MSSVLWVWLAVAVTMVVAEVAQPTSLYWPWAVGALAAAACEAYSLGPWWQWAVFIGLPCVILVISARLKKTADSGASSGTIREDDDV